jgi:hypothetical protein
MYTLPLASRESFFIDQSPPLKREAECIFIYPRYQVQRQWAVSRFSKIEV